MLLLLHLLHNDPVVISSANWNVFYSLVNKTEELSAKIFYNLKSYY